MRKALHGILAALAMGGLLQMAATARAQGAEPQPEAAFVTTIGGSLDLQRFATAFAEDAAAAIVKDPGEDVLMLHFVDCKSARCETSLRAIDEFVARPLAERDLRVIAIAVGSTPDDTKELAGRLNLSFPLIADPDSAAFSAIADDGVPRTLIIDKEGRVVYQHAGFRPGREAEYRSVVEDVLEGRQPPAAGAAASAPPGTPAGFNEDLYAIDVRGQQAPDLPVEVWINPVPASVEGKFRVIDFWATWCGPCRVALEEAEKIHGRFDERVATMAISDEDEATVRAYVREKGLKQPIGTDTQARTKTKLGIMGIPHAIVVNPAGKVVWQGHPMELWMNNGAVMQEILNGREDPPAGK